MPEGMIERVARALEAEFNGYRAGDAILIDASQSKESFRKASLAVLNALREPSDAMLAAPVIAWRQGVGPGDLYKIMIDVALEDVG